MLHFGNKLQKAIFSLLVMTGALMLAGLSPLHAEQIVNGGFEVPTAGGFSYIGLSSGLPGWTVVSGNVEVVNTGLVPSFQGNQSLDLDGSMPGAISQTFATVAGTMYTLTFEYANNYTGGLSSSAQVVLDSISQSFTHSTSSASAMNYTLFASTFVATGPTSTLTFTSLDPTTDAYGVLLDAVSVVPTPTPEPSTLAMLGVMGLAGLAAFRKKIVR